MKNMFLRAVVCPFTNGQTCKRTNNLPIDINLSFCPFTIEKIPALCQVYEAAKGQIIYQRTAYLYFHRFTNMLKDRRKL